MIPNFKTEYDIADHAVVQFVEKIRPVSGPEALKLIREAVEKMLSDPDHGPHKQHHGAWYYRYQEGDLGFTLVIRYPTNLGSVRPVVVSVMELPHTAPDGKRYKPGSEIKLLVNELNKEIRKLSDENNRLKLDGADPAGAGLEAQNAALAAQITDLTAQLRQLKIDLLVNENQWDQLKQGYEDRIIKLKQHIELLGTHQIETKEKYREGLEALRAAHQKDLDAQAETVRQLDQRYENLKAHCETLTLAANTHGAKSRQLSADVYRVLKVLEQHPYTTGLRVHAMLEDVMERYKPGYKQRRDAMIVQQNTGLNPTTK